MPFPILGSNSAVAGYEIDNSLRFNRADNPRLSRTPSSAGNRKTFTLSTWVKFCNFTVSSGSQNIYESRPASGNYFLIVLTNTGNASGGNTIRINSSSSIGGVTTNIGIDRFFRDPSAWYHLVFAFDTTQSTDSNRLKMYVNGEQTGLNSTYTTYPDQNEEFYWNNNNIMVVGGSSFSSSEDSDFYLADTYNIDGQQLAPTEFGETNDNGVWIPKAYQGTYGTNGFKLEFQNSGSLGTDTSGNGNNFTATNLTATDQTTDTPTNNFITWNALNHNGHSLQEGNTFTETRNSTDRDAGAMGNIGLTRGKWYWELKITAVGSHTYAGIINIGNRFDMNDEDYDTSSGGTDGYPIYDYVENGKRGTNTGSGRSETGVVQATYGNGDILNFALDLDNNKIHYGKNGTYGESSDPANNTNGIAISDGVYYTPVVVGYGSGDVHANFGQPAFSISSGNADANGHGNFEYAPPSGFFSICTKNLAETG